MTKITNPIRGHAHSGVAFAWLACTLLPGMGTPTGYRVGMAIPWMLGPVGFELGYRTVSENLGVREQRCGMDNCTPGPFDTVMLNPFVELSAGITGSLTWQETEYRPGPRVTSETRTARSG